MEYHGPERLSSSSVRVGQRVFAQGFNFGVRAEESGDAIIEIRSRFHFAREEFDAYDKTRVRDSFLIEEVTKASGGVIVIAARINQAGVQTGERIRFNPSDLFDDLRLDSGGGPYISENNGLCHRGSVARQDEDERYFRESYVYTDGKKPRVILEGESALEYLRSLQSAVSARLPGLEDNYKNLRNRTPFIAGRLAQEGINVPRIVGREDGTAPVEQYVNFVPMAVRDHGEGVWSFSGYAGTCTSYFDDERSAVKLWVSLPLYSAVPANSVSVVFLAVDAKNC